MDDRTKGNILYVVVVGAALGIITYLGPEVSSSAEVSSATPSASVEGEVLSIENRGSGTPQKKEAVVKLATGETVRAFVPPACLLFPGQIAVLSRFGAGGDANAYYVLKEAKEK